MPDNPADTSNPPAPEDRTPQRPGTPGALAASWPRRRFLGVSGLVGASALAAPLAHPQTAAAAPSGAASPARASRYASAQAAGASGPPAGLRAEHAEQPLALDTARPRLSWRADPAAAGRQTAYQVVVGRDAQQVHAGHGDLWDSGRVGSDQCVDVGYGGTVPGAGSRCHWAVRTWDEDGAVSGWSAPAWFEVGPLDEADWHGADWIQAPGADLPSLTGSHWIWYPEGAAGDSFPDEVRYFRRDFTLADASAVTDATAVVTADDFYDLYVNGTLVASHPQQTDGWQRAQVYDVRPLLRTGANTVAVAATNIGPTPAGLLAAVRVTAGASVVALPTDASWRTSTTAPTGWQDAGFDDSGWAAPLDQGTYGTGVWGSNVTVDSSAPAPLLRKRFPIAAPVSSARLYVCGLGYYVASLNGERVGDRELDPAPSVYDRTGLYSAYDVTDLLRRGDNTVGLVLGRSFYAIDSPNIYWEFASWISDRPAARLVLRATHPDGSTTTVVSDGGWETRPGPTLSDSVYNGDIFDARALPAGWDRPGAPSAGWTPVAVGSGPKLPPATRPQIMPPIRVTGTLAATSMTATASGGYVFRFPRLVTGRPRLRVRAPAGTTIDLRYGEILRADGTVDNQGDAGITPGEIQHDTYTAAGSGLETWEPSFSYGSFQYVQVDGYPGRPPLDAVSARMLGTDLPSAGDFHCSDDLLDTVHAMCRDTIANNLTGIPTDTPMYEKRGWLGDASLFCAPSVDNFDAQTFWTNFLAVVADDQGADGNFGDLAPAVGPGQGADPTWSTAGLVLPWTLYQEYGDLGILETRYAGMKRFVDHLTGRATGSILDGTYGDWCAPGYVAPPEGARLTSTGSYYRCAVLLSQIAGALGRTADQTSYAALAGQIGDAFNAEFLDTAAGVYRTGTGTAYRQSSNAYPLFLGLVPDAQRDAVVTHLVERIAANGNHLDTGIVGTMALFPALTEHGHVDLAHQVAAQRTYPGYGYWVSLGATTLWEQWIATPRSHDHAMFGSIDDWFYKYLAGIRPAAPGYRSIAIRPYVPSGLTSVSAHRDTPYGRVAVDWRTSGRTFAIDVTVPANTTATLTVPCAPGARVHASPGVTPTPGAPAGTAAFRAGPGAHAVTVRS
ncbi:alpha-L-rhamnosidase [Actinacidiphila yanglinensis]|uniref:alpha-L-rhamnosidase n=1 Tax=Actinacidiphila yanglinensis TaxID=310779 RepID=A0A1H5VTP9_9ACTN|nr:family 78 glycoside hydrolase catalytic domain [Actinacidiphila yanglinensis]SEF90614.1 alpha-L-rhamnosidase [Actinacidiphila yanglinensis]